MAYISLKINNFRLAMLYHIIVTSYIDRFSWFWYQWKEETLTLYYFTKLLYFGHVNFKITGGGNHPPLRRCVTKKRLKKTRVNLTYIICSTEQFGKQNLTTNHTNEEQYTLYNLQMNIYIYILVKITIQDLIRVAHSLFGTCENLCIYVSWERQIWIFSNVDTNLMQGIHMSKT